MMGLYQGEEGQDTGVPDLLYDQRSGWKLDIQFLRSENPCLGRVCDWKVGARHSVV